MLQRIVRHLLTSEAAAWRITDGMRVARLKNAWESSPTCVAAQTTEVVWCQL